MYFDATKVDANASLDSIAPRFAVEEHLDGLFEAATPHVAEDEPDAYLPAACEEILLAENAFSGKLDLQQRTPEAGGQGRLVQAHRRLPLFRDRSRRLAHEKTRQQGVAPRLLCPLRRRWWQGQGDPERTRYPLRGNRERAHARSALEERLPLEAAARPGNRRHGLRHHTENIAAVERAGIHAYVPLTG